MEKKPDNRAFLPPNYVSLRQLRERRLKEEQDKEKAKEKEESDGPAGFPPIYAPLGQPKEEKEKEKEMMGREGEKESDQCARVPPNYVSLRQLKEEQEKKKGKGREDESESRPLGPLIPPNYVSLRQLREQHLREEKEKENEKEIEEEKMKIIMKMKMKEKAKVEEEEKGVPLNYASLRQLKELRLQGDESRQIEVKINENACDRVKNLQSKKPDQLGGMKTRLVWQPMFPPAYSSTNTGISSANSVFQSENAGESHVSHEVMMVSIGQSGDTEMKPKNKTKKKRKEWKKRKDRRSRETTSGKNKGEALKGPELPREVTGLTGGEISATKEVALAQNENNTVKGKEEKVNLTKSSGQSVPVCLETKGFNKAQSIGSKKHNSKGKGKGKEVSLLEPSHNIVPVSNVANRSDALEEVIGSKIKYGKEQKGKREMGNISQPSDQTPHHEETKGDHGAGELIVSEIQSDEEKGRGKNVNMSELSKWGDQVGGSWMRRNQAAGFRGMSQQGVGRFNVRPAQHQRRESGGLVWVPKKNS